MKGFARMSGLHCFWKKFEYSPHRRFIFGNIIWNFAHSLFRHMPLTTNSLTSHDYEPLIDNTRGIMLCWSKKSLSFAGRL